MQPLLNIAVRAARRAGDLIVRNVDRVPSLGVRSKSRNDFVSEVDHLAERDIIETIRRTHPDHGFLGEESGRSGGDEFLWIIDPLDGTTNFLHGFPHFAVSLALERQGQIVAAVIYNPATDELYTAEKGGGAFLNDRRLRVAARTTLSDCIITCGVPHMGRGDHGRFLVQLRHMMNEVVGIRRTGSAALDLAYVAAGRVDGYWEEHISSWDIAAGILLVREAGGFVSDLSGGTDMFGRGDVIAGNEAIHKALVATVNRPLSKS